VPRTRRILLLPHDGQVVIVMIYSARFDEIRK
jgi:hypothetical protein